MSDIAVEVHNLGKLYRIGGKEEKYSTLRDSVVKAAAAPYRRVRAIMRGESAAGHNEEIWALNDVSFQVKHGEVVGIIGRNGAGKSTLLKILSRITEPTTGHALVYGRVGALLEVGTGFHPELTGRENVFLNGAILGMSRTEIERKFDEIVDFAGIEKFIDTPVKHYSSGMGLRLGFAVAAHLEPEILIIDEVLAVGDFAFQKKSAEKMNAVAREGRTVLVVSHNLGLISSLTDRTIWLKSGSIVDIGPTEDITTRYMRDTVITEGEVANLAGKAIDLLGIEVREPETGEPVREVEFGKPFELDLKFRANKYLRDVVFFTRFEVGDGTIVATLSSRDMGNHMACNLQPDEEVNVRWLCQENNLIPGSYFLTIALQDQSGAGLDAFYTVYEFVISHKGAPSRYSRHSQRAGFVYLRGSWILNEAQHDEDRS